MSRHSINRVGHRDANEPEFTQYFRAVHIAYRLLPPGFGADILVMTSPMWFLEIKNPEQRPSDRALTEDEANLQAHCLEQGIGYIVAQTVEFVNEYITELRR